MAEFRYTGTGEELRGAPDSLYTIFPEVDTLSEKAWKFLELHYECENHNRTAKRLGIHHATVKKVYNFLKHTDLWYQFTGIVAETTEDFGSRKNLINLHEQYQFEVNRLERMIQESLKDEDRLSQNSVKDIKLRAHIKSNVLNYIKEKRFFMDKQLAASLALKGKSEPDPKTVDDATPKPGKSYEEKRDELLGSIPSDTAN